MEKFSRISSVAAVLPEPNIDTDVIFPARYLSVLERTGLGEYLFRDRRFKSNGEKTDFVLNAPPYDKAQILIADDNFGSGSSREQAVWALSGFGIRCVIAPGFGEIFQANCYLNGVLPIALPPDDYARVINAAGGGNAILDIDLERQEIGLPSGEKLRFGIDGSKRAALLSGLDEIGSIRSNHGSAIDAFMKAQAKTRPWLSLGDAQLKKLFADKENV